MTYINLNAKIYYSKSENGFFRDDIHEVMPGDCVEITEVEHKDLLKGQAAGKVISSDINGYPCLIDKPKPSIEQRWLAVKIEVVRLLNDTDYVMLMDVPVANIKEFKIYRHDLRSISSQYKTPEEVVWPKKPEYKPYKSI